MIIILSCGLTDEERAARTYHYPHTYGNRHYLKIPYTITFYQLTYCVGDTTTITANFSNKIEDISYERIFEIDSMLLRPIITLMMFENNNFEGRITGVENI